MIRMKNRIQQVVVGEDYKNPTDCEVVSVWASKEITKGKVLLNGNKHPVKLLGGGVWMLTDGHTLSSIYPESKERKQA